MPDDKSKQPKLRYEDNPSLPETFADSISRWYFDGSTLRIEFTVSRFDERKGSEQLTGRQVPTCRLVLSTAAGIELLNRCGQFSAALEKAGVVKKRTKNEAVTATSKPANA